MLDDLLKATPGATVPCVAVPMAEDPDVIGAIGDAIKMGIASFILIGDEPTIHDLAKLEEVTLDGSRFIQERDELKACDLAAELVVNGEAQALMKGLVHTSTFSKAFLKRERGLVPAGGLVSHVALFEAATYHKPFIVTDAALNIAPNVAAKMAIIRNAVEYALRLGVLAPKVACVAAVERVNPMIVSTTDAQALVEASKRGEFAPAFVDGPFGFDVAIDKDAAETKGVTSPVAGDADVLLMPDLDSANVLYKTLTKLLDCRVASCIAGAKVPIILTSRADTEETKLLSIALAARNV